MKKRVLLANAAGEFAPIVAFVSVSETIGFMPGLYALMAVSCVTISISWGLERRIPKFGVLAAGTILFFGALSIVFDQPFFIIFKDTLYYLLFSLALACGLFRGKFLLRSLFGEYFALTDRGWRTLTIRWCVFLLILALGNELARVTLEPITWTLYKFFAVLVLWVFAFYQFTLSRKERLPGANEWGLVLDAETDSSSVRVGVGE